MMGGEPDLRIQIKSEFRWSRVCGVDLSFSDVKVVYMIIICCLIFCSIYNNNIPYILWFKLDWAIRAEPRGTWIFILYLKLGTKLSQTIKNTNPACPTMAR